jgi:hypothetical protein
MEGKRKFVLCGGIILISGALCAFSRVAGGDFANIVVTTVLAFSGANAGEHIAKAWGTRAGTDSGNR